jgi:hypothetical protein
MKLRIVLGMMFILATATAGFSQTTINLFEPIAIGDSDPMFDNAEETNTYNFNDAISFGTTTVFLACSANDVTRVTGANGGGFIADNFLTLNGVNICPNGAQASCYSNVNGDPKVSLNQPVETRYSPVPAQDISSITTEGVNAYTFSLMDYGYTLGSSAINLETTCTQMQGFPVCHLNNGKKGQKTIFVDSQDAVAAHERHGDTAGPCPNGQ